MVDIQMDAQDRSRSKPSSARRGSDQLRRESAAVLKTSANLRTLSRDILTNIPLRILAVIDQDGALRDLNTAWTTRLGYDRRSLLGRQFLDLVPPDDREGLSAAWQRLHAGERVVEVEHRLRHRNGQDRWFRWRVRLDQTDGCVHAIGQDITEHKELEAERERVLAQEREAHAQAEAAVRLREEFLGTAAHELKTPLTTIKGYLQLLERAMATSALDEALFAESIAALKTQLQRLETLVYDLLDVSRLQHGKLILRWEDVDLATLASEVLARFERTADDDDGHRLLLSATEPVVAPCDPARMDQVLSNLISNALKYSPNGGTVEVAVRSASDAAEILVMDEGMGISAEDQTRLFEPFGRSAGARGFQVTGLGLYIVQGIVSAHSGTITVDSAPGRGSRFTVRLPLRRPDLSSQPAHTQRS